MSSKKTTPVEKCLICNCKSENNEDFMFYNIFNTVIRDKYLNEYMNELFDVDVIQNTYVGTNMLCETCVDSIDNFIEMKKIAYSSNMYFKKKLENTPNQNETQIISTPASNENSNSDVINLCDSSNDGI